MLRKIIYLYKNFIPLRIQFLLVFLRNYEFYKKKDIFIHIPRNGGTFLSQIIGRRMGHLPLSYISRLTNPRHKFFYCILRNPLDRFISAVNYLSTSGTVLSPSYSHIKLKNKKDLNFLAKNINTMYRSNLVLYPQSYFIKNELNIKIIPIKFISFINIYNSSNFKFRNSSYRKFNIEDLDSDSIKCLNKFYNSDVELYKNLKENKKLFSIGIQKIIYSNTYFSDVDL